MARLFTVLLTLLLTAGGLAGAAQLPAPDAPELLSCEMGAAPTALTIEGLGRAYFEDFESDTGAGTALLFGNVCIEAQDGSWLVRAEQVQLEGLGTDSGVRGSIERALLRTGGWVARSQHLEIDERGFTLGSVEFAGRGFSGEALRLQVSRETAQLDAWDVAMSGAGMEFRARTATLGESDADLRDVSITTCDCPGEPLYTVDGSAARLDLGRESLILEGGQLNLPGARIGLRQGFELSAGTFEELSLPVSFEFGGGNGEGLGVIVPDLKLGEGLTAQFGLLHLFAQDPVRPFGLLNYSEGDVSFTVGAGREGPVSRFELRRTLADTVRLGFLVRNRHEPDFHYLHEGVLSANLVPYALDMPGRTRLTFDAGAFVAASAQTPSSGTVAGARVGVSGGTQFDITLGQGATYTADADAQFTVYPDLDASQYGVTLRNRLRYSQSPLTVSVEHRRRWTDSGSPFTTRLDRLTPQHTLTAAGTVAGVIEGVGDADLQLNFGYDLLRLNEAEYGGLTRLGASAGLKRPLAGNWTGTARASVELAGMLDPDPAGRRDGYAQLDVGASGGEWELGARARYALRPGEEGFDLLEARAAVPLELGEVTLTPFLALDFAPLVWEDEGIGISGHGVIVTWASCCGTLRVGYRQQADKFVTELSVALED